MPRSLTVVLDFGKTTSKATLWTSTGDCIRRETRANRKVDAGSYTALDVNGIETWLADVLADFAAAGPVGSIIPVAHGAAAAILRDGRLAVPPMDYECEPPEVVRDAYLNDRDRFSWNGSPPMGLGLNLGMQLAHLEWLYPELLTGDATILPWAQYWSWRLCGVAASEVSSLGSHTDLWSPRTGRPSPLAVRRGWAARLAPLRHASDVLGTLLPEWVARTGLPWDVKVHVGVHDSNAALHAARTHPEIAGTEATVISTGTWFVAMRSPGVGGDLTALYRASNPGCLINIDPTGAPVPTALFMGGREIEILCEGLQIRLDDGVEQESIIAAVTDCLASGAMILPTMVFGTGPFPDRIGRWIDRPADPCQAAAAIGLYAALVIDHMLDRIGARDTLLVEGRFANAPSFVRALATLRRGARVVVSAADGDVSFGTFLLLRSGVAPSKALLAVRPLASDLTDYRQLWLRRLELAK